MEKQETDIQRNLRRLIAGDKVEEAIAQLLDRTEGWRLDDLHKKVVLQSARLEEYQAAKSLGSLDADDLARTRVNINLAVLDLIDDLPEEAPVRASEQQAISTQKQGIRERTLKTHIMYLLLAAKLLVAGYLFTQWEAGGFTNDQFMGTLTLLVPLFATYTALIFKDNLQHRHIDKAMVNEKRVTRNFQFTTYAILFLYLLALWVVIGLKPQGIVDYKQMSTLLTLVEGALGVYVGQIVFALFKDKAA